MQNADVPEDSLDEDDNEELYDAMNREENKLDNEEEWFTAIEPVMPKIIWSLQRVREEAAATEAELYKCQQSQDLEVFNRSYTLMDVWEQLMDTMEYAQVINNYT